MTKALIVVLQQSLMALAHLRIGDALTRLAAGFEDSVLPLGGICAEPLICSRPV